MSGEPLLTVVGNACADAELRFTASGVAVASFTVAQTPRTKRGDEWVDGATTFYRCSAWRQLAESCAETITRGMRLVVHGRLSTREYEKDGQTRTSVELDVEAAGPDLRYATASVRKLERGSSSAHGASGTGGGAPADDPWGDVPPPDEPPPF